MSKIKICGLRRLKDIDYVNEAKVDFAGFILSSGFIRSVDKSTFLSLRKHLSNGIKAVGVFVNEDIKVINDYISNGYIDLVQLHGDESPTYCKRIVGAPVIKAIQFDKKSIFLPSDYDTDYILFDSGKGTGKTFDWGTIPKCSQKIFLAGGLDENNITIAKKRVNPYCIDISSSAETDGFKDREKILKLERAVRYE